MSGTPGYDTQGDPSRAARRRRVRLVAALVVAGGLTLTAGCGGAALAPPAAQAPVTTTSSAPEATTTAPPTTTSTTPPTTTVPPTPAPPPDPGADGILELGDSGASVVALQQQLSTLGYWLGETDGNYGQLTRQAVIAFQKEQDLGRDGVAGPKTQGALPTAARPAGRATAGDLIEIDLTRQLLLVIRNGQVNGVFNTSTGSGEAYDRPSGGSGVATTPRGDFTIQREIDGIRRAELGVLYRPKYFRGGIAVHGSGSIPSQPASHGCVRLTNAAMDLLWSSGVAEVGTRVVVY